MGAIKRLLIANRGEIACRIIRSCKRLGIESVAVFSDADRHALHVKLADLACHIGGSAASESYLDARAIVEAALKIKADSIHPGYGFLSESTALIHLCEVEDLIFVGPSLDSIAAMGSKVEAKAIAKALSIPTIPGDRGGRQDQEDLLAQASAIGFPVLIKASAGGGGKGMRVVHEASAFAEALRLAKREALSAFGDDRVLLEKYLARSRHIEVQVLGDSAGNVVHLFDRECSIQRNYQKVIEEAPASHLDRALREKLFDWALRLARRLSYRGAGTVEFIVDADSRNAYFLEMNTRLQVEHPTTELVTGIDLVEWQLRVAQGERLAFRQEDIATRGHAIEARINAEDPANNYLPEIGVCQLYREPQAEGLRVDSGIALGSHITPFYDSLLAKLIAHGETRGLATQRLLQGLNGFAIGGVKTNQAFLASLITRPAFHQELSTRYIQEQFPEGWQPWGEEMHTAIAAASLAETLRRDGGSTVAASPWQNLGGWRLTAAAGVTACTRLWLESSGKLIEVRVAGGDGRYRINIGDASHCIAIYPSQSGQGQQWQLDVDGTHCSLDIAIDGMAVALSTPRLSRSYRFLSLEESQLGRSAARSNASNTILALMPGLVTDVLVQAGDHVEAGTIAVVMEAMKLIQNLPCPIAGTIQQVLCAAGDTVTGGSLLVAIEPQPRSEPIAPN
jgi:3-methylcrotonyl-CoA carboxylase alpha subunit